MKGLKPQWCKWEILSQFNSALGEMVDVDWIGLAQNLAEKVRLILQCKDPLNIPSTKMFEIKK
jgi:hypothetical protein